MVDQIAPLPKLPSRITDVGRTVALLKKLHRGSSPPFFAESLLAALAYLTPNQRREVRSAADKMSMSSKTPWSPPAYLLIGLVDPAALRMNSVANLLLNLPNLLAGRDQSVAEGLVERLRIMGKSAPDDGIDAMFARRVAEVAGLIDRGESQRLLAYPDYASGHVDPARVLDDLTNLAMTGMPAGAADLEQTVLRFPANDWPFDLADEFATLGSPDASWVSTAIAAGPVPAPTMKLYHTVLHDAPSLVTRAEWPQVQLWDWPLLTAARSLPQLTEARFDPRAGDWMRVRAQALPSQRELVAAHLLRTLVASYPPHNIQTLLPHLQGPCGPSVLLCLAYGASSSAKLRYETTVALRGFAATGDVDGIALGQAMASVGDDARLIKLGRWAHTLDNLSKTSPLTAQFAWNIMQSLLNADVDLVLADRSGYTHLLEVARQIARRCSATGRLAFVDRVVAKRPRSKSAALALQLQDVLDSPITDSEQLEWEQSTPSEGPQDQH